MMTHHMTCYVGGYGQRAEIEPVQRTQLIYLLTLGVRFRRTARRNTLHRRTSRCWHNRRRSGHRQTTKTSSTRASQPSGNSRTTSTRRGSEPHATQKSGHRSLRSGRWTHGRWGWHGSRYHTRGVQHCLPHTHVHLAHDILARPTFWFATF